MKRLFFLDIFRLVSIFPIVLFHFFEFTFDQNQIPLELRSESVLVILVKLYSYISFSGQSVVAISAFLIGFKGNILKKTGRLIPIFALGYLLILFEFYDHPTEHIFYWDIYPFLLLSLSTLVFLNKSEFLIKLSFICGLLMFLLPYREMAAHDLSFPMKEVIWGICKSEYNTSWPLTPWTGFVWIFNYFGFVARKHSAWTSNLNRWEILVYLVSLGYVQLAYFGTVPIGESLYCYISLAPWRATLSYFFLIYLFLRVSILVDFNTWLSQGKVFEWISSSAWSKNFAFAYLLQLAYLGAVSKYDDFYKENPGYFLIAYFLCFVFVELSYFGFGQSIAHFKQKLK